MIFLCEKEFTINKNIIPIILITLFAIQGFTFCLTFEDTTDYTDPQEISEYIIHEIPDYKNYKIAVYNIRPYLWYLGENTVGISNSEITKVNTSNIDYYISNTKINDLNNFKEIKHIGKLYLYEKSV